MNKTRPLNGPAFTRRLPMFLTLRNLQSGLRAGPSLRLTGLPDSDDFGDDTLEESNRLLYQLSGPKADGVGT